MVRGIAEAYPRREARSDSRTIAKFRRVFAAAALGLLAAPAGCGGSARTGPEPVPSLAHSLDAQAEFRRLETRFADLPPEARATLAPDLRRFLVKYGSDDRARMAALYLAWIELDQRRTDAARALVEPVRRGPVGAPRDFANVIEGGIRLREGKPGSALEVLLPLDGKIADPLERGLYSVELVHALVAVGSVESAVRAMLDWAEQAAPGDRDAVVAAVEQRVREIPPDAYERGLDVLDAEARADPTGRNQTRAEARRWLSELLQERLVRAALTHRDPELAKRLVEAVRARLGRSESVEALEALAATSVVAPKISGRTVGVVLNLVDETSRGRSAALVAGVTRTLRGSADGKPNPTSVATRDAADAGEITRALAALAGDGASILVAGVTEDAAIAAALYAERAKIPVILLSRPPGFDPGSGFAFALGTDPPAEEAAVAEALASEHLHGPARVGPGGTACDTAPARAGLGRFPVAEWKRSGADALVLLGDVHCTQDVLAEAADASFTPFVVLGLESAHLELARRRAVVSAGRFPFRRDALAADEQDWVSRYGAVPSWYEALGHDAALLAARALAELPGAEETDPAIVQKSHDRAASALASATANLWTTRASGFGGSHAVPRELHAVLHEADSP